MARLKPVDAGFAEMMNEVRALDTKRSIIAERKVQSHIQKRRDQTGISARENWTENQTKDYASYKALVKSLADANKRAVASSNIAKARDDEQSCKRALADQKAKAKAAIRYV